MSTVVYRMTVVLSSLLQTVPVGTNLGLLQMFWMLMTGRLLESRGAVIPGLAALGLEPAAVRRAWAALSGGHWQITPLLTAWEQWVAAEGRWQAAKVGGYQPLAVDLVGFFRPRLQGCPTKHYSSQAGKSLPAIPLGMVARVGAVGAQRLALPLCLVRADPGDPSEAALQHRLLKAAAAVLGTQDVLVADAGFQLAAIQAAGVIRYLLRGAKNFTARGSTLPPYKGVGRPPTCGETVRPLARQHKEKTIVATPADRTEQWSEDGKQLRAEFFEGLVRSDGHPGDATFTCVVIHDPRYSKPLLLLTNLELSGQECLALYRQRWPIEQLPLAGKQMLGAGRQFVFAPECRQRLPELALLAGSILSYLAATTAAVSTGFWDRAPRPTIGRLRRALSGVPFSAVGPLQARLREKASPTAHLPKGVAAHRRKQGSDGADQALLLAA